MITDDLENQQLDDILNRWVLTLSLWKSSLLTNFFFGVPLILAWVAFGDLSLATTIVIFLLLVGGVGAVWLPLWFLLGKYYLKLLRKAFKQVVEESDTETQRQKVVELVEKAIRLPYKLSVQRLLILSPAYGLLYPFVWSLVAGEVRPLPLFIGAGVGFFASLLEAVIGYSSVSGFFDPLVEYCFATYVRQRKSRVVLQGQKYSEAVDIMGEGIIGLDGSEKITIWNRQAEEILGRKSDDVMGESLGEIIRLYGEEDKEVSLEDVYPGEGNAEGAGEYRLSDARVEVKGRGERYIDLIARSTAETEIVRQVISFRDITDEVEEERTKIDLVAMAAHDLRAPLTSIIGYLAVLQEEVVPQMEEEHRRFFGRVTTSANQLTTLIENILSLSKIERGKLNLQVEETDWVELVRKRIEDFRPRAEQKGLSLEFVPPAESLPPARVDAMRVSEVLDNLLSNAVKYTKEGKVTVSVEYDADGSQLVTHVEDTGPGIPRKKQMRLFEKFYRVTGSVKDKVKGTGLGLYISRAIVELHGGDIWVKSTEGEGSTFSFSLPAEKLKGG